LITFIVLQYFEDFIMFYVYRLNEHGKCTHKRMNRLGGVMVVYSPRMR